MRSVWFPPPWTAEVTPNCFIVRDANGQALSYIYYESEPGRRSAAKLSESCFSSLGLLMGGDPSLGSGCTKFVEYLLGRYH